MVYRLYAMMQLFTEPPQDDSCYRPATRATTRFVYWVPAIALGLVSLYDLWITSKYLGESTTPVDYIILGVEMVMFAAILVHGKLVGRLADRIDGHWREAQEEIKRPLAFPIDLWPD